MQPRNLEPAELVGLRRIQRKKPEQPAFAKRNQLPLRQNERTASEHGRSRRAVRRPAFIAVPKQIAGLEIYAAQPRIRLVAAAETIKMAVVVDRRAPMRLQRKPAPDF